MKKWTSDQIQYLIDNYPFKSCKDIAGVLNKTPVAIYKKAKKLNLQRPSETLYKIRSESRKGEKGSNWKGGRKITKAGYVMIYKPGFPGAQKTGYIFEHRYVMSIKLGRELLKNEIVHHKNKNKQDNRLENLEVMLRGKHTINHHTGKKRSEKTRQKIGAKTKERFINKKNHPFFKNIDPEVLINLHESGKTVKEICLMFGICKRTFYNKVNEIRKGKEVA